VQGRDLDFRFKLPDPILEIPEAERPQRVRESGDVVGAEGVGVFVRVMLRVMLTDDFQITYGTWLALMNRGDFDRARRLWHSDEYSSLVLEGVIANGIEPWGPPLMTPARASVKDVNQVPYVETIYDESMAAVLDHTWPRSWVLSAIPHAAWHSHAH
jgi:hypothetical protein